MAYTRTHTFRHTFSRYSTVNGSFSDKTTSFTAPDTKSGQRVERWKEKIASAQAAGSPYNRTAYVVSGKPAYCLVKSRHKLVSTLRRDLTLSGVINPIQTISPLTVSSPENEALSRLYSSIRDKQAGMNGLLILGEIRETIKMLRRPGEALLDLFGQYLGTAKGLRKQFQSRKGANRKNFEKALSGMWLELQFGWKPLISDCQDVAKTVARIVYDNALRTDRARGKAGSYNAVSETPFLSQDLELTEPSPRYVNSRQRSTDLGVRYVAGIRASTYGPVDSFSALARETGFTLDNFVPTVWNLIPYSFLVDYFTNIGDCIEASFTDTSGVAWWTRSQRQIDRTYLSSTYDPKSSGLAFTANDYVLESATSVDGNVEVIRTTLARTAGTVLPTPSLTVSLPGLDGNKWWNILALWKGKAAGTYRS